MRAEIGDQRAKRLRQDGRLLVAADFRELELASAPQAFGDVGELKQRPRQRFGKRPGEQRGKRGKDGARYRDIPLQASYGCESQLLILAHEHDPAKPGI